VTWPRGARSFDAADEPAREGLGRLCAAALGAGLLMGLVGAAFRLSLVALEQMRDGLVEWAHGLGTAGFAIPLVAAALGVAVARSLVRLAPLAAGSGIQHVEAVVRGESEHAGLPVLFVKFAGGLLAIGSGLALGREGPTVQMGATIGTAVARWLRAGAEDVKAVMAAASGAGLGVAFNAPVGGAIFVFEELTRVFRPRLTLATLIASAAALAVSRPILGDVLDFRVAQITEPDPRQLLAYVLVGALLGALAVAYNRAVVIGLELNARLVRWPVEIRAGVVGAAVGLVAWFGPSLVGDGHFLNQRILAHGLPALFLALVFVVRFVLGPVSYSAGTPGGLFAPLLLVGAAFGALAGSPLGPALGAFAPTPAALAVVGMAAFFAAVVQAPLTGIVLIAEMTGETVLLVPMLAASVAASLTASLLGGRPIYDVLRERMLEGFAPHPFE
jgi:CIC family chloride channel protein